MNKGNNGFSNNNKSDNNYNNNRRNTNRRTYKNSNTPNNNNNNNQNEERPKAWSNQRTQPSTLTSISTDNPNFKRENQNSNKLVPNTVSVAQTVQDTFEKPSFEITSKPIEKCTLGERIGLFANHYLVTIDKEFKVFQYDVAFYKDSSEINVTKEIANEFTQKLFEENPLLRQKIFYDFKKNLYSFMEISFTEFIFEMELKARKVRFKVEFKKASEIFFEKDLVINTNKLTILQLAFTFEFKMNCISLNSQRFFTNDCKKTTLGDPSKNLDSWSGFFTSLRPTESGLTININRNSSKLMNSEKNLILYVKIKVFHSAFTKETNLIDLACMYFRCRPNYLKNFLLQYRSKTGFVKLLTYFKISPTHLNYRSKKRARGLGRSANEQYIQELKCNLVKYYKDRYNKNIMHPDLPCVDFGNNNLTPLELCVTVVENKAHLDKQTQGAFIKETAIDGRRRFALLNELQNTLQFEQKPILNEIKAKVNKHMIALNGQLLESVEIEYGKSNIIKSENGRWDNKKKVFYKSEAISKWVAYSFCDENELNLVSFNEFVRKFIIETKKLGITISEPEEKRLVDERDGTFEFFEKEIARLNPNFILAILPGKSLVYNALKTIGDIQYGIQTQSLSLFSVKKTQNNDGSQLISNISLKINSKLGGTNFIINQENDLYKEHLKKCFEDNVMIFGCDVNKPSPTDKTFRNRNENTTESMAAVTGSIDKTWSYYASRMLAQRKNKKDSIEYINDLKYPVKELLGEYKKANGVYPTRLIFFRDGISEGEFQKILNHEMNEIRTACTEIELEIHDTYRPPVTFIVVQKRHQTRFFFPNPKNPNQVGNILPGTLVDSVVVTPENFDYFLGSHNAIQGTTKPCHYYILHDENKFSVNAIVLLSHYLCHIYERSTTAVSYPAPTYYADHCAERAREYLTEKVPKKYYEKSSQLVDTYPIEVHENFRNKMFYI